MKTISVPIIVLCCYIVGEIFKIVFKISKIVNKSSKAKSLHL